MFGLITRVVGAAAVGGMVVAGVLVSAAAGLPVVTCNASLQQRIDAATDGQVITVSGPCMVELTVTNTHSFTLQGDGSAAWTPLNPANNVPMLSSSDAVRFTVAGITFQDGSAANAPSGQGGGAIAIDNAAAAPTIRGNTFLGNRSDILGGAVAIRTLMATTTQPTVIDGNTFGAIGRGNTSGRGGAVTYFGSGALQVTNNTFIANAATEAYGGGIYVCSCYSRSANAITVSRNTFGGDAAGAGNVAANDGGGAAIIFDTGQPLTVAHNRFVDNAVNAIDTSSSANGGGLWIAGAAYGGHSPVLGTMTQSDNEFSGNTITLGTNHTVGAGGGGEGLSLVNATSRRDVFVGNRVANGGGHAPQGGGLWLVGMMDAAGDVVRGNGVGAGGAGGGISVGPIAGTCVAPDCVSHLALHDSTVVGNSVDGSSPGGQGSAIWGADQSTLAVDNAIVFANRLTTSGGFSEPEVAGFAGGSVTFGFSDVCTAPGGATPVVGGGNICVDPQLNTDGQQTPASPTIDRGSNALTPADVTTDLNGKTRMIAGRCGDGAIVDMGAFEASAPSCPPPPTGGGTGGGQGGGAVGGEGGDGGNGGGATVTRGTPTVGGVQTGANTISVTVGCQGTAPQTCDGDASLYTSEHKLATKIVSLSRKRSRTIQVAVGHAHFALHAGQVLKLTIPLNSTGRTLLRRFGRIPAKLVLTINTPSGMVTLATRRTTIKQRHKRKH